MTEQDVFLKVAWHYLGTPYVWGGDDPSGLDCSGYAIECLRSVGAFPRSGDTTADGLMRRLAPVGADDVRPCDLVFFLNGSGRATHVGIILDPPHLYIGAEGGRSSTSDADAAWAANAFVKVCPLESRGSDSTRRSGTSIPLVLTKRLRSMG